MAKDLFRRLRTALIIVLISAINLGPIVWGVLASLRSPRQLMTFPPKLFGSALTLVNYHTVLDNGFLLGVRNSLLYGAAAVLIAMLAGSTAAYGFDRFTFRGRKFWFLVIVACIPLASGAAVMVLPNYLFFARLHLVDKWFTLPIMYAVYSLPMAIWIVKGGLEALPRELDEAARIDGASSLMILVRIILPLAKPVLGAASLFVFIHAWNEFVLGSVMVEAPDLRPVQVLVYQYIGYFGRDWGPLTAAATFALLPVIVLYGLFGRLLVGGLTQGAVKD